MIDRYVALYTIGLGVALFVPVILLLALAWLQSRPWREPRDPVRRLRQAERGRQAQAQAYDPSTDPCKPRAAK